MENRDRILMLLADYQLRDDRDRAMLEQTTTFVKSTPNCFERSNLAGHITGSAWIVSPDNSKALLMHHKKHNKWQQFGGHCDGDSDVRCVALREAMEESGISDLAFVTDKILDIDVHLVGEKVNKGEPAHYHYDVRFLLRTKSLDFKINHESNELRWFTAEELKELLAGRNGVVRMLEKWQGVDV